MLGLHSALTQELAAWWLVCLVTISCQAESAPVSTGTSPGRCRKSPVLLRTNGSLLRTSGSLLSPLFRRLSLGLHAASQASAFSAVSPASSAFLSERSPHDFQNDLRWSWLTHLFSFTSWNQKQPLYMPSRPWAHESPLFTPHLLSLSWRLGDCRLGCQLVRVRPASARQIFRARRPAFSLWANWGLLPASDIKSPSQLGQSMLFRVWSGQLIYYRKSPAKE